ALLSHMQRRGACFLVELQDAARRSAATPGSALGPDAFETALWDLVWGGLITNDTFAPLRSLAGPGRQRRRSGGRFGPAALAGGRWSLVADLAGVDSDRPDFDTERQLARARMLLERYGVVSREAVAAEGLPGGFGPLYRVLKLMEESGRVRRGHFVEGLSGAQFALPGAIERLRAAREDEAPLDGYTEDQVRVVAASDPASPYGALLGWPATGAGLSGASATDRSARQVPKRVAGALLILVAGRPVLYLGAAGRQLLTFPEAITDAGGELPLALAALRGLRAGGRRRLLIRHIDGLPALESPLRDALLAAGFEPDYDALVPGTEPCRGSGRDPSAVLCAGPGR
ncbi:MAG: DEAD/DEAH box helicase, partial [Thiohalocapsa sp.]